MLAATFTQGGDFKIDSMSTTANRKYLIGVDLGTQGAKAGLFRDDGKAVATRFHASKLYQPSVGVVEEDPEYQVKTVCQCIKGCLKATSVDPRQVVAIGIDGQMAGVVGVGADGHHLTPYDSWLDTRCAPYIDQMQKRAGRRITQKAGAPPSFNHGPKKLWWKHERPKVYRNIAAFVQPAGYAAMRLCGLAAEQAFVDDTYLHFSGFADNARRRWDKSLCKSFDFDAAKLPKIVSPTDIVGELTSSMARRCGLGVGTRCVAGCGDATALLLACGATQPGICVNIAGTASVFAATTEEFTPDTEHQVLAWTRAATPGLWHPLAYINGGGMNLEWFARELATLGRGKEKNTLTQLNRLAEKIKPQIDDPMFIPHLGGRVMPAQPNLRGSWAGLAWSHTAGHLYRAMLEAVALEYGVYRQVLTALSPQARLKELRITGGGAKSRLWNQIKADALNMHVLQINRSEGAPLGVAMLAAQAAGIYASVESVADDWISAKNAIRPNKRNHKHYEQRLARYQQLLDLLDQWANH